MIHPLLSRATSASPPNVLCSIAIPIDQLSHRAGCGGPRARRYLSPREVRAHRGARDGPAASLAGPWVASAAGTSSRWWAGTVTSTGAARRRRPAACSPPPIGAVADVAGERRAGAHHRRGPPLRLARPRRARRSRAAGVGPPADGAARSRGRGAAAAGRRRGSRSTATRWPPRWSTALGGRSFEVGRPGRPTTPPPCIASNHLVALMGQVERVAAAAGVPLEAYLDLAARLARQRRASSGRAARHHRTGRARRRRETLARHRAVLDPLRARGLRRAMAGARRTARGAGLMATVDPHRVDARASSIAARAGGASVGPRAHDGLPARRPRVPDRAGGSRPRRGRGHRLRQPTAVRAQRGPRGLPARPRRATRADRGGAAARSLFAPSVEEMYPEPGAHLGAGRRDQRAPRGRSAADPLRRRRHRGGQAVRHRGTVPGLLRREGLAAARGRPPHGPDLSLPGRRWWAARRSASPTAWPCRAATSTSRPRSGRRPRCCTARSRPGPTRSVPGSATRPRSRR